MYPHDAKASCESDGAQIAAAYTHDDYDHLQWLLDIAGKLSETNFNVLIWDHSVYLVQLLQTQA